MNSSFIWMQSELYISERRNHCYVQIEKVIGPRMPTEIGLAEWGYIELFYVQRVHLHDLCSSKHSKSIFSRSMDITKMGFVGHEENHLNSFYEVVLIYWWSWKCLSQAWMQTTGLHRMEKKIPSMLNEKTKEKERIKLPICGLFPGLFSPSISKLDQIFSRNKLPIHDM